MAAAVPTVVAASTNQADMATFLGGHFFDKPAFWNAICSRPVSNPETPNPTPFSEQ
jgi:hypothetical protein